MISQRVIPEELMAEFSLFLNDVLGLYFPKERWNELEKKFLLIMGTFGVSDPSVCLQLLKQDPFDMEKVNCIAHYLTVGETGFFRDPFTFRELEHRILPEIIHRHYKDRTIRIWCAGCCTGEEPYSIAIVLHRLMTGLKSWDIRIVGTDVNREFLNKAEQARYKKWSFRSTPP